MRVVSSHDSLGVSDQLIESAVNAVSSANAPTSHTPRNFAGVRASRGTISASAHKAPPASISRT